MFLSNVEIGSFFALNEELKNAAWNRPVLPCDFRVYRSKITYGKLVSRSIIREKSRWMWKIEAYLPCGTKVVNEFWTGRKRNHFDPMVGMSAKSFTELREAYQIEFLDQFGVPVMPGDFIVFGDGLVKVHGFDPSVKMVIGTPVIVGGKRVEDDEYGTDRRYQQRYCSRYNDEDATLALMR